MIKSIAKVYNNRNTVLPAKILNELQIKNYDVVKWTYNSHKDYIKVDLLQEKDLNIPDYNSQIFYEDDLMILYRRINRERTMIFPAEIAKVIHFNNSYHLLEWCVNNDELFVKKYDKGDLINISGILKG